MPKGCLLLGGGGGALLAGIGLPGSAAAQAQPFTWTGFYLGGHVGGAWQEEADSFAPGECGPFTNLVFQDGTTFETADDYGCFDATVAPGAGPNENLTFSTFDIDDDYVAWTGEQDGDRGIAWIGGGHLGANFQVGRLIFGLEGDISALGDGSDSDSNTFDYFHSAIGDCDVSCLLTNYEGTGTVTRDLNLEWLSTIRGRVGAALGAEGRLLVYGTGGLALAGIRDSLRGDFDFSGLGWCDDCSFSEDSDESVEVGFTVGGGAEYAVTNNLVFGLEYLFTQIDYGSDKSVTFFADDGRQFDIEHSGEINDFHVVRARMSWLFNGPP
jgi:opacity protein-like surface antigen